MGLLDRLLGREEPRPDRTAAPYATPAPYDASAPHGDPPRREPTPGESDARAVERYRYLLRTAPPETVEQAHAEAFAQLTPEQRRQVLAQLGAEVPAAERATTEDPRALARMATRAEMRRPGTLERSFGGVGPGLGGGVGMGGLVAGTLLSTIAGAFIGTAIADAMFDMSDSSDGGTADDGSAEGSEGGSEGDAWADGGDAGSGWDGGGDVGGGGFGGDFGGGDFGGDFGGEF